MRLALCVVLSVVVVGCKEKRREPPAPAETRRAPARPPPPAPAQPPAPAPPPARACDPDRGNVCRGDAVVECTTAGELGTTLARCKGGCRNGTCVDSCQMQGVELVYVLDADERLYSFDPRKLPGDPFHQIGTLDCGDPRGPNSMAVDRTGVAWIGANSGKIYSASILNAHCVRDGHAVAGVSSDFGMGFVTDGPNARTETLYVTPRGENRLGAIDTSSTLPTFQPIASLDVPPNSDPELNPELTGTSEGKLFGYFPEPSPGFVQEIDRKTGKRVGKRWDLPGKGGSVGGWAFAQWGGVFYVFVTLDGNSAVHAIRRKTGKHEVVRENLPFRIIGAGVSTCAPMLERPATP